MEKTTEINGKKIPEFHVDPELNKYDNVILFPERLARAKESIQKLSPY